MRASESCQWPQEPFDTEQGSHRCFHVASGAHLHEEASVGIPRVADDVHVATRYVRGLSDAERALLAADTDSERSLQDFNSFVLPSVDVPWHPTSAIKTYFDLEEFATSLAARSKEGQMLSRERTVQIVACCHPASLSTTHAARK